MSGSYTIGLSGLKEGRHTIDFEIDNKFFESFEESEIKEGSLFANIELEKRSSHADLFIRISGECKSLLRQVSGDVFLSSGIGKQASG